MAANVVTGQISDGPIAKYHQKGIFQQCAKFHACIIKCTIQPNICAYLLDYSRDFVKHVQSPQEFDLDFGNMGHATYPMPAS